MKLIFTFIWGLLCLAFTFIPEITMYLTWQFLRPETELAKLLLVALFYFVGSGACLFFAFFGLMIWTLGISKYE